MIRKYDEVQEDFVNLPIPKLFLIGLIRKMPTLKPVHLALWNVTYFVASTKQRTAENLNLISYIVLEL